MLNLIEVLRGPDAYYQGTIDQKIYAKNDGGFSELSSPVPRVIKSTMANQSYEEVSQVGITHKAQLNIKSALVIYQGAICTIVNSTDKGVVLQVIDTSQLLLIEWQALYRAYFIARKVKILQGEMNDLYFTARHTLDALTSEGDEAYSAWLDTPQEVPNCLVDKMSPRTAITNNNVEALRFMVNALVSFKKLITGERTEEIKKEMELLTTGSEQSKV